MIGLQLKQLLLVLDQLFNVLIGVLLVIFQRDHAQIGWADETLSARAYRQRHIRGWSVIMKIIDRLFFWQTHHCKTAFLSELKRRHLPPEYRDEQNTIS